MKKPDIITTGPRETWPTWECMPRAALARLMQYQWDEYGYNLELEKKPQRPIEVPNEVEGPEEIDRLIRQPTRRKKAGA